MDPKSLLSSITYVDTERSIVAGQMKITHTEYEIHLYEDKLTASTNEFNLMHVWDISYKTFSDDANLFLSPPASPAPHHALRNAARCLCSLLFPRIARASGHLRNCR